MTLPTLFALIAQWLAAEALAGREPAVDAQWRMTVRGYRVSVSVDGTVVASGDMNDAVREWEEYVTLVDGMQRNADAIDGKRVANTNQYAIRNGATT